MNTAIDGFATNYAIMAAYGKLMLLALAAVGEGVATHGLQFELMRTTGGNAQHAFHHPCPLFAMWRYAAEMFPYQQMCQFVRHHFFNKGFTVFQQQNGIEVNFIAFQPGCSGGGSALGVREFWIRLVTP